MQRANGLTLVELVASVALAGMLVWLAIPALSHFVDDQAAVSRANNVLGLIRLARASGATRGPVLLCAEKTDCSLFPQHSTGIKLVHDANDNRRHDSGETVLYRFRLRDDESISWRSFRARPWLRINGRGVAWYQNGHFLLCHGMAARQVIVNRQGQGRVAPVADHHRRCLR